MQVFSYVYILESEIPGDFYVGLTDDVTDRLSRHNAGAVSHTSQFRPWRVKTEIAFRERDRAAPLEHYLKTSSGRAFAQKHL